MKRGCAAVAFFIVVSGAGPSRAESVPTTRSSPPPEKPYDGFFAYTFDAVQRSHDASTQDAAFTQRAYRASIRVDYFGRDNTSALGSIPGIEGVVSLGWAGGASYSGMNAGGNAPAMEGGGGVLVDFDLIGNWSVVSSPRLIWQVGPRLSFDIDSGQRDVGSLSMGVAASTRVLCRITDTTWGRLELDHQLADFIYDRHDQLRLMVTLDRFGVVAVGGTGKTMGSGFIDVGLALAFLTM